VRRISAATPGGRLSRTEVAALAAGVHDAAPELQRRIKEAGVSAALSKLNPDLLLTVCATIVADLHKRFKAQGFCPLASAIVSEVVDRMRACARRGDPLTPAQVANLHRLVHADVMHGLRRHADANASTASAPLTRGGGVMWKWFGKAPPGTPQTKKPLLPPVPLLVADADGMTALQAVGCLAANAAIVTLVGIALCVTSLPLLGLAMGVDVGQKRQKADMQAELDSTRAELEAKLEASNRGYRFLSSELVACSKMIDQARLTAWDALRRLDTGAADRYIADTSNLYNDHLRSGGHRQPSNPIMIQRNQRWAAAFARL
jgi:hypothetical protein